jgi:tRNA-Thr(GGU) m(6)t(6)A37 methyltransferase TsaA
VDVVPVAYIRTPYRQKFPIPRQPNLVKEAIGDIHFVSGFADSNMLRGLDGFSHVWLIFAFHETADKGWTPTVTPPRLGGSERVGVFASRSPYRPNPLGLSVVEKVAVMQQGAALVLRVRGVDLLDGTPILDIKPYLPYADSVAGASGGYAEHAPASSRAEKASSQRTVDISVNALSDIKNIVKESSELTNASDDPEQHLQDLIRGVLLQDPRPAQHTRKGDDREYGMLIYHCNVRWRETAQGAEVLSVEEVDPGTEQQPWTR